MNKRITIENELTLELINDTSTAQVVYSPKAYGFIQIPKSVQYQSRDYLITTIKKKSFRDNDSIKGLDFPQDSAIVRIEAKAFDNSNIESLYIPASLEELEEGWCSSTKNLKKIIISPQNKLIKYLDEQKEILISKSDKNSTEYDSIIFCKRDVKHIKIPTYIKHIQSYSFEYCDELTTIEIPENSQLQTIGKNAFSHSQINSIFIPSEVESIEEGFLYSTYKLNEVLISPKNRCFTYGDELHQILIGKSDKNSDNYDILIHGSKNIEKVILQPTIKRICNYAFHSCSILKTIEIPENSELKSIGKNAFVKAPINHIFIPEKVEELQDGWCYIINYQYDIEISQKNRFFKYLNDEKQMILNVKKNSIVFANKSIIEAEIPSYITEIESFSFYSCKKLKTVKFSENSSLKKIGQRAFRNTCIQNFTIPKSVEQIDKSAFYGCWNLKQVEIEDESKLQSISDSMFCSCNKLEYVKIPEKSEIKIIQRNSFGFCPITQIYIPSTVEEIDENLCMYNKKLVDIKVSPKNKNFKVHCGMLFGKSDNDSENFDIIKLACQNISNTIIPDNVKYIEQYAFQSCVNLNIKISDESELKILGKSAFHYCDNLPVFNIPKSLKFIGNEAFHHSNIESLYIPASLEELEEGWCSSTKNLKKIIISPQNKLIKYLDEQKEILISKSDKNSTEYDSIIFCKRDVKHIKIPTYIKHIQSHSFEYCDELTTIEIPENSQLQTIGKNAFSNTSIKEITIPKNIEYIQKGAFESCRSLKKVKLEKGSKLKKLSNSVFIFCRKLKSVEFPEDSKLEKIESSVFSYTSIENFYIPKSVKILAYDWCDSADRLKKVTVSPENKNIKFIDDEHQIVALKSDVKKDVFNIISFVNKSAIKVTIPAFIKKIFASSFAYCNNLIKIEIPQNSELWSIDPKSFVSTSLKSLLIPRNVFYLGYSIFWRSSIRSIEFACDFLYNEFKINLFVDAVDLQVISFPNIHYIRFNLDKSNRVSDFIIFINPEAKIDI